MARDFYVEIPVSFPSTLAMATLRAEKQGMAYVGCYYELVVMVATSLQEGQCVTRAQVPALARQWGMRPSDAEAMLGIFADLGLISAEMWCEGLIRIESVAERFYFKEKKSAAGREGGRPRKAAEGS